MSANPARVAIPRIEHPTDRRFPLARLLAQLVDRFPSLTPRMRVIQAVRLLELHLRRSPGVIAALVIALATFFIMFQALPKGVVYWSELNWSAAQAMIPVCTIAGAIAAWTAQQDERRRLHDQLQVTSFSGELRQASTAFALMAWCVTGYLSVAIGFFALLGPRATWASPEPLSLMIVVAGLLLSSGFGWFIGTIWNRPLAAVVVALIIWGWELLWQTTNQLHSLTGYATMGGMEDGSGTAMNPDYATRTLPDGTVISDAGGFEYLFHPDGSWRNLVPQLLTMPQAMDLGATTWGVLWMAGLGGLLFWLATWIRRRSRSAGILALVMLFMAGVGGAGAVSGWVTVYGHVTDQGENLICATRLDDALTVCVHPSRESLLPDTADSIASVIEPIAGRTWVPMRWEEGSREARGSLSDGIGLFHLFDLNEIESHALPVNVVNSLLANPNPYGPLPADYVVLVWLLENGGISREEAIATDFLPKLPPVEIPEMNRTDELAGLPEAEYADATEVDAAIARFLSLPDAEREAWLDQHWPQVFTGELTLEDLP